VLVFFEVTRTLTAHATLAVALGTGSPAASSQDWWDGCDQSHRQETTTSGSVRDRYIRVPDGRTLGTLPPHGTHLDVDSVPDLVAVVGDSGIEGFADSCYILGKGEAAPRSPAEALRMQGNRPDIVVPVHASNGMTVIDVFTIPATPAAEAATSR
jgi:hypothetical protein